MNSLKWRDKTQGRNRGPLMIANRLYNESDEIKLSQFARVDSTRANCDLTRAWHVKDPTRRKSYHPVTRLESQFL
ncbi:UNVERIFIED_CONTAM: hypothetical protein FKN15_030507 [Acipenser sinensis]